MSPEQPPRGEHASNGVVEESGKTIRDMAKVLKLQLETRLGRTLHMKEPILHWLIRWSAMALSVWTSCPAPLAPNILFSKPLGGCAETYQCSMRIYMYVCVPN